MFKYIVSKTFISEHCENTSVNFYQLLTLTTKNNNNEKTSNLFFVIIFIRKFILKD